MGDEGGLAVCEDGGLLCESAVIEGDENGVNGNKGGTAVRCTWKLLLLIRSCSSNRAIHSARLHLNYQRQE